MTMGEALSIGMQTSVIGLTIVFAVLIILMLVLKLFEKIFYKAPKDNVNNEKNHAENINTTENTASCKQTDDEELIAVLTAAIAASLNTSTYNLKIKSYRRIGNGASAWNKAGVRETIENRF